MSTPKTTSSLRNRGRLLLGGALFLALPLLGTASCVGAGDGTDSNAETERSASSDEDALSSIQKHPHKAVCSEAAPGFAHCHARIRTAAEGNAVANATPQGLTPASLQGGVRHPCRRRRGPHGGHRRRRQRSQRRERSRRLPRSVRPAPLHDGQRLLQEGEPDRLHRRAPHQQLQLGRRNRARSRHGQRRLPELQDPSRRGQELVHGRPRDSREPRRHHGRGGHLQQLDPNTGVAVYNTHGGAAAGTPARTTSASPAPG